MSETALARRARSRSAGATTRSSASTRCRQRFDVARLPFSLKVLLENLLRTEGNGSVDAPPTSRRSRSWDAKAEPSKEIAFTPARVLMQDFTGVPAVVDLAAMRDAIAADGRRPGEDQPARAGRARDRPLGAGRRVRHARRLRAQRRARVRAQPRALRVPALGPGGVRRLRGRAARHRHRATRSTSSTSRAWCSSTTRRTRRRRPTPTRSSGTDSHTTMVNGLGVLGWGVGGIEAEAAMLGQPMSMLIPQVVGFRLHGALPEGATATDLVLTVTEMLRERGVVGKFVEFYGAGLAGLPLADRATIGNMSPEFGSTCAIFPIDAETLALPALHRAPAGADRAGRGLRQEQGLWHDEHSEEPTFSRHARARPREVEPSLAGPKRPQDRVPLSRCAGDLPRGAARLRASDGDQRRAGRGRRGVLPASRPARQRRARARAAARPSRAAAAGAAPRRTGCRTTARRRACTLDGETVRARPRPRRDRRDHELHQHLQPVGDGRRGHPRAQRASRAGCTRKPWVKTSLAPGSKVVTEYLDRAGLTEPLEQLGFNLVGYGCTTCIGNSGPLPRGDLAGGRRATTSRSSSVLSGNRNFEGRINPDVKMNYLASPPLCVAYALAGHDGHRPRRRPARPATRDGEHGLPARHLALRAARSRRRSSEAVQSDMFRKSYAEVFDGDERWNGLDVPDGRPLRVGRATRPTCACRRSSRACPPSRAPVADIEGARVLAVLGDSVTTDHISPAGSIKRDSPAGRYLQEQGVAPRDFNSYGARRGNHEVMMRGTFANIRLRNLLGGTGRRAAARGRRHPPPARRASEQMSIYDAAMRYAQEGVPLVVLGRQGVRHRAPRATGRRRAPSCSACAP